MVCNVCVGDSIGLSCIVLRALDCPYQSNILSTGSMDEEKSAGNTLGEAPKYVWNNEMLAFSGH